MRKVIAAINMTLDGFCDHTAVDPDAEVHDYYRDLIKSADLALYGRITYQLMEYWKDLAANPSGEKSMDEFAVAMDNIPKVVFTRTLHDTDWNSARIAKQDLKTEILELRQQPGGDILVGSRSLIISLINLSLIDEFQIMIHPVIAGGGLPLMDQIKDRTMLKLAKTKTFNSGATLLFYQFPGKQ
ncbi:dihydrofolate reductase family protein [Dyadobacter luticola]|uniref:Dihydrofolate reductase n=1 Tax=Dyadobacter luticola TaxID=1979387 RepID=A0A5R9L547_9BACT|nr:dihydrofolate reductase family protein [Dyadobacter luticola]TLV03704.1 dihydrofolate reductase [Dyadobacter luticola]